MYALTNPAQAVPFELKLRRSVEDSLSEASQFFQGKGQVHRTVYRIAERLQRLNVPYAIAGGMALNSHGYLRVTTDVDIIVAKQDLVRIHAALDGLGFIRPFAASKNLRDTETGVRIEFLIAGEFPGDGKPKDVAFPNPSDVAQSIEGVNYLNLPTLITLKLASGMTGQGRQKDIGDVVELIKILGLRSSFASQLHPYVQPTFIELSKPFELTRQFIVAASEIPAEQVVAMRSDGVTLTEDGRLVTHDESLAEFYGMKPDTELE